MEMRGLETNGNDQVIKHELFKYSMPCEDVSVRRTVLVWQNLLTVHVNLCKAYCSCMAEFA